jgi:hypothetical protein
MARICERQRKGTAFAVLRNSSLEIEQTDYDTWNEVRVFRLAFSISPERYAKISARLKSTESELLDCARAVIRHR